MARRWGSHPDVAATDHTGLLRDLEESGDMVGGEGRVRVGEDQDLASGIGEELPDQMVRAAAMAGPDCC
jgi:hypothetical protein